MPEVLTLTSTIVVPDRTTYRVVRLVLDWLAQVIQVDVRGSDNVNVFNEYLGAEAVSLMTILNTSNLTTASLHKRVLQKLVTDGKLPSGTVSGTPE